MIEIRELVIEARVVDDTARSTTGAVLPARGSADDARLIERITQRVLALLNEQRERL